MKAFLLAVCGAVALNAAAAELPIVPLFRFGVIADAVGMENLVTADLTGDHRPEIISCSNGSAFALEYRGGAYPQLWYGPSLGCNGVAAGDADEDGTTEVIVVNDTELLLFDTRGLGAPRRRIKLQTKATDVAFGNVDFDAAPEIIVAADGASYIYDATTLALQWKAQGHGGLRVVIADVDGDERDEVLLDGGSVLDAGNQVQKWAYLGGFPQLAAGNLDGDAKAEIIFGSWYTVTVLQGDTQTTSTLQYDDAVEQLLVGDADGDGANEVIAGNNQWGDITGRRASDGALLWSIHNPEHGVMGLAVADVDADGVPEVLWGAGWTSSGDDVLFVADAKSKTIKWESLDLDGWMSVAAGDLDGDGRAELVVASSRSHSGYAGAVITVFDAITGAEERVITVGYSSWEGQIAIAQLDGDAAKEIAIKTEYSIRVFDGVTGVAEWTSAGSLLGMVVANVDGDPVDEIITRSGDMLIVLHGASNIVQSSRLFNGRALAAADVNGDGAQDIVAATSSTLYLLAGNLTTIVEKAQSKVGLGAATSAGGGRIAIVNESSWPRSLQLFDATLTQQWTCGDGPAYPNHYTAAAFATIGGQPRLIAVDTTGVLRAMPLDGNACPAADTATIATNVHQIVTADVTGDGRTDILFGAHNNGEMALIGAASQMRGDVNGDQVIASNDIDELVDYLFGAGPGLSTSGDANADARLSGEDIFALIHHEYGGGSLPE